MTKPSKSVASHQLLFGRVLGAWASDGSANPGSRGQLSPYLENLQVPHSTLALFKKAPPVDMWELDGWVVGRPVPTREGNLFPVASGAVKAGGGHMMGTVRIGLFQGESGGLISATGLRFESAEQPKNPMDEGASPPHTYPHSQPSRSWSIRGVCLLHPYTVSEEGVDGCPDCFLESTSGLTVRTDHFNAHRPAVPLRCRTLPGLALSAMTAVYGANVAREILDTDANLGSSAGCPQAVVEDFEHVLGEDGKAGFPAS